MKLSLLIVFYFYVLTLTYLKLTVAVCHVDDQTGLLAFKSGITSDPSGILHSWNKSSDCCTWNGITCNADNRVTEISPSRQLDKPNTSLTGTISPLLWKLKYLVSIYLNDLGNISGQFPSFLFELPNLKYVYIENNKLSGPIPNNIGKLNQLEALSLEGNRFVGKIPSSVSNLTQLGHLKLGNNLLSGVCPIGIGQLKSLTLLSLDRNQLSGNLPDIFSSFTGLFVLELSHNKFTGTIPKSISALAPTLRYLELGHNYLTGKIPDFLGQFKSLDTLDLSKNRLSGTVPKTFANLTKIFNLDLSNNLLVDPFPAMKVKGIETLDLSNNMFHLGKIPNWVSSSPIIYSLKLAKCGITMKLDDWKPVQTDFYDYIDLSGNHISGSPIPLMNRTEDLVSFSCSNNKLKFNMTSLKIRTGLRELDLSRNLVFGNAPKAIIGLKKLNVSYNHLCGQLPINKFPGSTFVGNDCLCGSPLSPCKA